MNDLEYFENLQVEKLECSAHLYLIKKLSELELTTRTANCMTSAGIYYIHELVKLSKNEVLHLQNLGKKSFAELEGILEEFGLHFGMEISTDYLEKIKFFALNSNYEQSFLIETGRNNFEENLTEDEALNKYIEMGLLKTIESMDISARLINCLREANILYIGDLVIKTEAQLFAMPNFGQKTFVELKNALSSFGLSLDMRLNYWPINNINELISKNDEILAYQCNETLKEAFIRSLEMIDDSRHLFIMQSRLGALGKIYTLEETARELGITRERVRQIQKKITQDILKRDFWHNVMHIRLKKIMKNRANPLFLNMIEAEDSWFFGFKDNSILLESLILNFSHMENINFIRHEGETILSYLNTEQWQSIQSELINILEITLDVGHTADDIEMFISSSLAKKNSSELSSLTFDLLSKDLNFNFIDGELTLVSVGNTLSSHLVALLESVEKPMHVENIKVLYEQKYGVEISLRHISTRLGGSAFKLFGRGLYGVAKHLLIPEKEQNLILQKVEKIIFDGSTQRQWHTKDLLEKLDLHTISNQLNIYTLNIILKLSKKLRYLGRFSWKIRSIDDEDAERLHIRIAVHEALKEAGSPLHIEELQDLVSSTRGIGDYFLPQPNEIYSRIDASTWGLLDRDFKLNIKQQHDLKELFFLKFSESEISLHKTELLNAVDDKYSPYQLTDNLILGILISDSRFKPWHGGYVGLSCWLSSGRKTFALAIKEIADNAKESMTTEQIVNSLKGILGYSFNKQSISVYLNKYDMFYDQQASLWRKRSL